MRFFKKVFIILLIGTIFYSSSFMSFAEGQLPEGDQEDQWEEVTNTSDLVEAFRYYCKSRDLTIDGSITGAVTATTTDIFNGICSTLGINITQLQAELKKSYDSSNGAVKYLFTQTGINAYNRIFSQFLQDNELSVGDTNVNKQIYSGLWVTDADNNGCYASIFTGSMSPANLVSLGTPLKYGVGQNFKILYDSGVRALGFHFVDEGNKTQYIQEYIGTNSDYEGYIYDSSGSYTRPLYSPDNSKYGYYNISAIPTSGGYYFYLTVLTFNNGSLSAINNRGQIRVGTLEDPTYHDTSINIVAPVINNNNYEGDTIINNNGDTNNYTPPSPPAPDGGTPPDDWDIQLPNLDHDWLIHGLEKKFPFDIPFNLLFALSILNAEPQTPRFQGDLDLGIYVWHYDLDFAPFEDIARYFREFQFFAFIVGLMLLTKQLIWG